MRKINCLEIIERDTITHKIIVKARFPFDELPDEQSFNTIEEFQNAIDNIQNPHAKKATATRLWFILNIHFPNNFFQFSKMDWKWDEEYFKHYVPGTKGL